MAGRELAMEYSRRLPPPEAWKKPGRWIDFSTGLARADASKLVLPTDDRDFVKTDEAIEYVLDYFFWPDYDWPYSSNDPETALDKHHFQHRAAAYDPVNFEGSLIPSKFREIPTLIGVFPRQFHNVMHDFTAEPDVPGFDAMQSYYEAYQLAYRAFSRLITSAKGVSEASKMFALRSETLRNSQLKPKKANDLVVQEMMRDVFNRHFKEYGRAVIDIAKLENGEFPVPLPDKLPFERPHLIVKKVGSFAARTHVTLPTARTA